MGSATRRVVAGASRPRVSPDTVVAMAKRKTAVSATEARTAHTKQKPKPRFVSKAHRLEKAGDVLEFDDVRRVLARAESARSRRKLTGKL